MVPLVLEKRPCAKPLHRSSPSGSSIGDQSIAWFGGIRCLDSIETVLLPQQHLIFSTLSGFLMPTSCHAGIPRVAN